MQFVHNHPAQSCYAVLVKYQVEVGQEGLADIYILRLKEHCNLYYDLGFRGENDMAWEQPPEDRGLIKCKKGKWNVKVNGRWSYLCAEVPGLE